MNLGQELFDWLNETHKHERLSGQEAGLLVVPLNDGQPEQSEQIYTAGDDTAQHKEFSLNPDESLELWHGNTQQELQRIDDTDSYSTQAETFADILHIQEEPQELGHDTTQIEEYEDFSPYTHGVQELQPVDDTDSYNTPADFFTVQGGNGNFTPDTAGTHETLQPVDDSDIDNTFADSLPSQEEPQDLQHIDGTQHEDSSPDTSEPPQELWRIDTPADEVIIEHDTGQESHATHRLTLSKQTSAQEDSSHHVARLWSFMNAPESDEPAVNPSPAPEQKQSKEWQEANTGFTLSLDEPPPEIWTRINSPTQDDPEDDEEEEYEQGMSLQGAAYIPKQNKKHKHGINFTQRLQKTLQGRRERAAKLREEEEENSPHHPYISKALIMCGTLVVALLLSWVCLWFMQDGIAAYVDRIHTEQEQEQEPEQPEAPIVPETPKQEERILPPVKQDTPPSSPEPEQKPEPVIIPITTKTPPKPTVQTKTLLTFDEALTEANNAYNIGMYSKAIINFHRALALRENDIRPYIGLAASYRARGMYFDAKRLLDEAWVRFGRNPTIETERYYLRRE